MDDFKEYLAQQAQQRERNESEALERRKKAEIDARESKLRQSATFQREVETPMRTAAKAIRQHVDTQFDSEPLGIGFVARLVIGGPHAPRKVGLSVVQNGLVYVLAVEGPVRGVSNEETVNESDLAPALQAAIKDAVDRWFGTNKYQKG